MTAASQSRRANPRWSVIRSQWLFVLATALLALPGFAAPAPGKSAVASAHPLATEAGIEILARGGNAFDAAVAVSAALAVVEPNGSGLGGGGFYLLHRASDGKQVVVDAREVAPAAATRDMFLDAAGNPIDGLSTRHAKAAGIPGEPAGWQHLASNYGKLPLAVTLEPAIRLARKGFVISERMQDDLARTLDDEGMLGNGASEFARIYLAKGKAPPVGHRLRQPDLARSLEVLARGGAGAYYQGPFARKLVQGVQTLGGLWTLEDLAGYRVVEREPIARSTWATPRSATCRCGCSRARTTPQACAPRSARTRQRRATCCPASWTRAGRGRTRRISRCWMPRAIAWRARSR